MRNIADYYKQNLPAGRYWIGDPFFLFHKKKAKKKWQKIIDKTNFFLTPHYKDTSIEFWASDTGIGEGLFFSTTHDAVIIESGVLGIVPIAYAIEPLYIQTDFHRRGFVLQFDFEFEIVFGEGFFKFGHVGIDTTCLETFKELA